MNFLQEKFQVTVPTNEEAGEPWAEFKSMRHVRPTAPVECLPTTGILEPTIEERQMRLVTASATDVTDVVNPWDFQRGFAKHPMAPTDDQYTGEHADQFYGDAGGFVERNNYLDRN